MLIVVALGGAAAEQNVTTTTAAPGAHAPPQVTAGSCPWSIGGPRPSHQQFPAGELETRGLKTPGCHLVCDRIDDLGDLDFKTGHKTDPKLPSTVWDVIKDNLFAKVAGETKKRCYGCPTMGAPGQEVCTKNGGTLCYTQAQIDALFQGNDDATRWAHGCFYGSHSNTCAYEGQWEGKSILDMEIIPEESCRYSWIHNTIPAPGLDAIKKLIEGSPVEV
jgi:hypothetical protein